MTDLTGALADVAIFRDAQQQTDVLTLSDGAGIGPKTVPAVWVTVSNGVGVAESLSKVYVGGVLLSDLVKIHLDQALQSLLNVELTTNIFITIHGHFQFPIHLSDTIGLHVSDLDQVTYVVELITKLKLVSTASVEGIYGVTLLQGIKFGSLVTYFFGDQLVSLVSIGDTVTGLYQARAEADESLMLTELFGTSLHFRLDLAEWLNIAPADVVNMIYTGDHLLDGVAILAAHVDPGGGFTTWAINTRTAAVTEYQNYTFNSVAKSGLRYLGAASDGLWALDGEQDGGIDIAARIKSGWMQLAGSKFTSFKAAYLGLRVSDDGRDFFLKLHAGDGREYVYAVRPQNMQTTKVNMGKGLRSRYFSFELVTVGADFDLDSLEFVPISSARRV